MDAIRGVFAGRYGNSVCKYPPRQDQSAADACQTQRQHFRQQLAAKSAAGGAQGHAHRHFPRSRAGPGNQQDRQIHAPDQQQAPDCGQQDV